MYKEHPDWAIAVKGRTGTLSRNQYVLDFSRKDVRDCIYEKIRAILSSANIEYVKWDMNRQLTDLGSLALPADRQGELSHRYVLGVYEMQERLTQDFPDLLLENCSGGGARFDPGMLYYSPQIWCSDDTDAIERLGIQEGTALIYPLSAMGAHVSTARIIPWAEIPRLRQEGKLPWQEPLVMSWISQRLQRKSRNRFHSRQLCITSITIW